MSFPIKSATFDATIAWKFPSISRWSNSSSAFSFNSSLPLPLLLLASSSSLHLHYKRVEVIIWQLIVSIPKKWNVWQELITQQIPRQMRGACYASLHKPPQLKQLQHMWMVVNLCSISSLVNWHKKICHLVYQLLLPTSYVFLWDFRESKTLFYYFNPLFSDLIFLRANKNIYSSNNQQKQATSTAPTSG